MRSTESSHFLGFNFSFFVVFTFLSLFLSSDRIFFYYNYYPINPVQNCKSANRKECLFYLKRKNKRINIFLFEFIFENCNYGYIEIKKRLNY
jgi:hypothetical protein